jgi:predicted acylesterase/phospholipase RssA
MNWTNWLPIPGARREDGRTKTTEPVTRRKPPAPKESKVALVLAGGGITGAVYEIGALRAIDDILVDLTVNDFDVYVGTSAGALVCSLVANGYTPAEIMQAIDNRHPEVGGFQVADVLTPNLQDYLRLLLNLPRTFLDVGMASLAHPRNLAVSDLIWELAEVLPAGLYDGSSLERYVRRLLEMPGRVNRFDFLDRTLFIVATELDSGTRAVFGKGGKGVVPISRAVAASAAIPLLYRPVQIFGRDYVDGGLHGTASLDLAIEEGAKLVICINPMVPLNASRIYPNEHYIRDQGMAGVLNQTVRTLLHSSLRYHIKNLQAKYPDVDIILIQPDWDDQRMFSYSPLNYSARLLLAEHGFERVTTSLLENFDYFRRVLMRHGIRLRTDLVSRELDAIHDSHNAPKVLQSIIEHPDNNQAPLTESITQLENSLEQLDRLLRNA